MLTKLISEESKVFDIPQMILNSSLNSARDETHLVSKGPIRAQAWFSEDAEASYMR